MLKPERLAALCDGVFAIAITLLVLGLDVPSSKKIPDRELMQYLFESLNPLMGYVVSFVLIGCYWLQHYVVFHYVVRVDRRFVLLNGIFLLFVSFVPFPTGVQAAYRDDPLALMLYAATQFACGASLLAIWWYATWNHQLVLPTTSAQVIRKMSWSISLTPIVSLVAIVFSRWNVRVSHLVFLAIPVAYFSRQAVDAAWSAPGNRPAES